MEATNHNSGESKRIRRYIPALYKLADYYGDCVPTFISAIKELLGTDWKDGQRKLTFKQFLKIQDRYGEYNPEKYPVK